MPVPSVSITKSDGNTGVVKPGSEGILAIIAPSEKGTANVAGTYTRPDLALTDLGYGRLVEDAAYVMAVAKNPVVLIRATATTAASAGTVTHTGAGTSVVTVTGAASILDDYDVLVTFTNGGTVGVAGILYTYSLDGGTTTSAVQALGIANTLSIPNTGVTLALAVGTILTGQTEAVRTTGPRMTNADLVLALEALRITAQPYDAIYVGTDIDATMVATLDTWLSAREGEGKFKSFVTNLRMKNAAETETAYATAMATASSGMASIRGVVGADGGDTPSQIRGFNHRRPTALFCAARGMAIDISRDAANVSDGPLQSCSIADSKGNPKWHDEYLYANLDGLRLATLRSFPGREGVYLTNPNVISAAGSDYVYWQHTRVMNKACELTWQLLTGRLSSGVRKDPATGYILEADAAEIEQLVNETLERLLEKPSRVSGVQFVLSRTDDLSSNAGATLTGEIQVLSLAYAKKFNVTARFVRRITAAAA